MSNYGQSDRPAGIDKIDGREASPMSPLDKISFSVLDNIRLAATESDQNPHPNYVSLSLEGVPCYVWMYKKTDKDGHSLLGVDVVPAHTHFRGKNKEKEKYLWSVDTPDVRKAVTSGESIGALAVTFLAEKMGWRTERLIRKFSPEQLSRLSLIMSAVSGVTGQPQWESIEDGDD